MTIWWALLLFFAFMQTDSLLLGKVYSAYEDLIVCFKLQADWKKDKKSSIVEKGKGAWQCQELYVAGGAHTQK